MLKKTVGKLLANLFPEKWKTYSEYRYWRKKADENESLTNDHYEFFYTTHFDLGKQFYQHKKILDIGCGPRGSLEWADAAERRVGLDPLADKYRALGIDEHQMEYCSCPSENIPFSDSYFDVVCAFNSLDHVSNVDESITEIKRVTKPTSFFLLLVEINHAPTNCEPHQLKPSVVKKFEPEFQCLNMRAFKPVHSGMYDSIKAGRTYTDPQAVNDPAWLSAKFRKR